jgi:hypothetical protein
MTTVSWPAYAPRRRRTPWGAYRRVLRSGDLWSRVPPFAVAWALYAAGLFVPLPWVEPLALAPDSADRWPFRLVSDVMTGGALERGTLFAGGLWVVAAGGLGRLFAAPGRQPHPARVAGLAAVVAVATTAWLWGQGRLGPEWHRVAVVALLLALGQGVIALFDVFTRNSEAADLFVVNSLLLLGTRFLAPLAGLFRGADGPQVGLVLLLLALVPTFLYLAGRQRGRVAVVCVKDQGAFRRSEISVGALSPRVLAGLAALALVGYVVFASLAGAVLGQVAPPYALLLSGVTLAVFFVVGAPLIQSLCGALPSSVADRLEAGFWVIPKGPSADDAGIYRVGAETAAFLRGTVMACWWRGLGAFLAAVGCLFGVNVVLLLTGKAPLVVAYGPLVQLWAGGNLVLFVRHLAGEVRTRAQIEARALRRGAAPSEQERLLEEAAALVPGAGPDLMALVSEGVFAAEAGTRRETLGQLLDLLRGPAAGRRPAGPPRAVYLLPAVVLAGALALGVLTLLGTNLDLSVVWVLVIPLALPSLALVALAFLSRPRR